MLLCRVEPIKIEMDHLQLIMEEVVDIITTIPTAIAITRITIILITVIRSLIKEYLQTQTNTIMPKTTETKVVDLILNGKSMKTSSDLNSRVLIKKSMPKK